MAVQQGTIRPGSLIRPSVAADFLSKSTAARIGLLVAVVRDPAMATASMPRKEMETFSLIWVGRKMLVPR